MQIFVTLRYDLHDIGGSSNVIIDSSTSSMRGGWGKGGLVPPPLKAHSPHLYYRLSKKLFILLHLWIFPKFAGLFYERPFKPLNTLSNKV